MLPTWCPNWTEQYDFPQDPEAVNCPSISRFDRTLHPRSTISEPGILIVAGLIIAIVQARLDRGVDVSIPPDVRPCTRDLATTCSRMDEHLHSLAHPFDRRLRKGDCICLLDGCTGIAVLRPTGAYFELVLIEHSKFDRIMDRVVFPKSGQIFGLDFRAFYTGVRDSSFQEMKII